MATVLVNSALGTALTQMLTTNDDIVPGYAPGYELCKQIYLFHPLGAKIAEKPLEIALAEAREISVPNSPESRVVEAFQTEWDRLRIDTHIENVMRQSRIYGIASLSLMEEGIAVGKPVDFPSLYRRNISFNVLDPLNTAGSLVLAQDPLAMDFQATTEVIVNGTPFHRSRSISMMNESPIFIAYTHSAYGFVGRSVYQRALFPMRSFIQTMIADDMVARKAAVLVAKMKQAGSVVNNAMLKMFGVKRAIVKEAENGNVIGISPDEDVVSLNFQNLDGPMGLVRENIIKNIASASRMPAKLLTEETFAEGFGEGSEDAKAIAHYIDGVRDEMAPLFDFMDRIVQHRAWNPEFYKTVQRDYPEYGQKPYETAFYEWKNSFGAKWPSLLKEPDSELVKVDEVKLRAVVSWVTTLLPILDAQNKARVIEWAVDNFNALKFLFDAPLVLDYGAIAEQAEKQEQQQQEQHEASLTQPQMPGMPGQGGGQRPPGQPGAGGAKPPGGGQKQVTMGSMSLGGASAHDANDPVIQFQAAVARMLEARDKHAKRG
jgi:hypothetical protein